MPESERMAVVETRLEYLIGLVEGHVEAGCDDNNCKLNDRVLTCETNLKVYKRLSWVGVGGLLSGVISLGFFMVRGFF